MLQQQVTRLQLTSNFFIGADGDVDVVFGFPASRITLVHVSKQKRSYDCFRTLLDKQCTNTFEGSGSGEGRMQFICQQQPSPTSIHHLSMLGARIYFQALKTCLHGAYIRIGLRWGQSTVCLFPSVRCFRTFITVLFGFADSLGS